ncbi:MAG: MerR family transcriptional regulator [Desulfuromonas sp.]|jgi:DNA-binding transcriptional MerR regulator|nr:MAG: MerR family transcriptional regulator [Desulfuromonas sp.]
MNVEIPDKLFFKIGEVAAITGVKPHVLRYWESEFGAFSPSKSRTQQRQYQKKDIELVLQLKDLLYNQGFTIAGARKALKTSKNTSPVSVPMSDRDQLIKVRDELRKLREFLND